MSIEDASEYNRPFEHTKKSVKPERDKNRRETYRNNWWRHGEYRPAMREKLARVECYFAVSEVSKWALFISCPSIWLPGNKTKAVASDDFYVFGILTSNVHRTWMHAQKSTLEDRTAYTHNTCFETFPFPQMPSPLTPLPPGEGNNSGLPSPSGRRVGDEGLIQQIRTTALELHDYRSQQMEKKQWGITKLYNEYFHEPTSQLFKLHAKLDQLVLQAYGFNPDDDLLEKLLTLNLELAEKEKRGEPVVGPWAPKGSED